MSRNGKKLMTASLNMTKRHTCVGGHNGFCMATRDAHSAPFARAAPCHPTCAHPATPELPLHPAGHRIYTHTTKVIEYSVVFLTGSYDVIIYGIIILPDESESSALSCVPISGNINISDVATSFKYTTQIFGRCAIREVVDFQ